MRQSWNSGRVALACLFVVAATTNAVHANPVAPVITRDATRAVRPERAVYLDITRAGTRLVAVGERGLVVYSDDNAKTWVQAEVPTSVSLTAVTFADPRNGWAVGHSGVVLHTSDAGVTWERQLDGNAANQMAMADADARGSPAFKKIERELVAQGPDSPFLAVTASDARHVIVAGANGLLLASTDGGRHWTSLMSRMDNPRGLHLYALALDGETMYVAGERGFFSRSTDAGRHFERVTTPYQGTFFDMVVPHRNAIGLAGMRGSLLWSTDAGHTFRRLGAQGAQAFSAVASIGNDVFALGTQAGTMFLWRTGSSIIRPLRTPSLPPISGMVRSADGSLVVVGYGGLLDLPLAGVL